MKKISKNNNLYYCSVTKCPIMIVYLALHVLHCGLSSLLQWIPLLPYLVNCILFYRSEANDLALSIAKAATESSHVLALDG